jgi:hypothetical protein
MGGALAHQLDVPGELIGQLLLMAAEFAAFLFSRECARQGPGHFRQQLTGRGVDGRGGGPLHVEHGESLTGGGDQRPSQPPPGR